MQNPPTDRYASSTSSNAYCPSVPISVYRELAAELQAAQAKLDSLTAQNQQLVKQNQQLRQEVEKVVQSAQHLQQVIASFGMTARVEMPSQQSVMQPEPRPMTPPPPRPPTSASPEDFPPPPPKTKLEPPTSPYSGTYVIEQEESRSRRTSPGEGLPGVNGWLLAVAILLIVLTAFGTGFLIVRPLLNNNNNNR